MIFGPLPIKPEVLATKLVRKLAREVQRCGEKTGWTNSLKAVLRRMGQRQGHLVNPDPEKEGEPQFLLDLVWWKNKNDNDIVLAVESERAGIKDVSHDFGKLLVVKAPLKLMVFKKRKGDTIKAIVDKYMRKFSQHVKGENYLLLEFDIPNKEAHPFHFVVPSNGRLNMVTFRSLPTIVWQ